MQYLLFIGGIVVILVTGLIKIRRSANAMIRNHNFVNEFRQKFIQFITPYLQRNQFSGFEQPRQELDGQLYHWLVSHMDKTQRLLGFYGRAHYTAPIGRFQVANYEYIINTINQISTGDAEREDLAMCDNMMVRYIGAMDRIIDDKEKDIKNPVMWLQQGIQFYIGLPIVCSTGLVLSVRHHLKKSYQVNSFRCLLALAAW